MKSFSFYYPKMAEEIYKNYITDEDLDRLVPNALIYTDDEFFEHPPTWTPHEVLDMKERMYLVKNVHT